MKKLVILTLLVSTLGLTKGALENKGINDIIFDKGHFEEDVRLAYTSFEEPVVVYFGFNDPGNLYTDTYTSGGDACASHDLVNESDLSVAAVDTVSLVTTELGVDASFVPPAGCDPNPGSFDDGLSNDRAGITNFDLNIIDGALNPVGGFTDGVQGYQIADPDGTMIVTTDIIDLTGRTNNSFSVDFFLDDRNHFETPPDAGDWEADDSLRIYAKNVDTNAEYEATSLVGGIGGIDSLGIEYTWQTSSLTIPDNVRVRIIIEFTANSGREKVYIDNLEVRGL